MSTTISKRITAIASGGQTKRITDAEGFGSSYRTWGNSWGNSWGSSWQADLPLAQIGATARVTAIPSGGQTQRVTGVA